MTDEFVRWLAIGVLAAGAMLCTALLRWARGRRSAIPNVGWAMLGGLMAGVVLGPLIFGRLAPDQYEAWFAGGAAERIERDRLISRQGADLLAAAHAGYDDQQMRQLRQEHERELIAATQAWRLAQWEDQTVLRGLALVLIALVLLNSSGGAVRDADRRQGWLTPLSIGVWAAILPGGLAFAAMVGFWGFTFSQAALIAAALAIGPWMLTPSDREAADQAEFGGARMIQTAGRIASLLAIITVFWAMWRARGSDGVWMAAILIALPVGWLIGLGASNGRGILQSITEVAMIPALAAAVAVKIELFDHFAFWPLVVILLLSDDGRWLGAFIGAMLPGGRGWLRTTRLVIGSMSVGVTQLAVTAVAVHAWAVPEKIVLPLFLGALLIEFTAPMRRKLVEQLIETEEMIGKTPSHG